MKYAEFTFLLGALIAAYIVFPGADDSGEGHPITGTAASAVVVAESGK